MLVWHDEGFLLKQWLFPTCTGPCWSADLGLHVGHVCLLCQMCNPLGTCTAAFHTYVTKIFYKIAWLLATWDKAKIQGGAQSKRSDSTNLLSASPAGSLLLLSVWVLHLIKHHPAFPSRVMNAESLSGDDWRLDGSASAQAWCPNQAEFPLDIFI